MVYLISVNVESILSISADYLTRVSAAVLEKKSALEVQLYIYTAYIIYVAVLNGAQ